LDISLLGRDSEGFCDILREKSTLQRGVLYIERLRIVRSSCCCRLLKSSVKKTEELTLLRFFYHFTINRLVKCILHCTVVEIAFAVDDRSAPEYFSISNVKSRVFDRRVIDSTDIPSQEGREDVPSELSFRLSAPGNRSDACTDASKRGDSPGGDLSHGH